MEFKLGENSTIENGLVIKDDTLILVDIMNRAMLNHSNPMEDTATAAYILDKGEEGFKIIPGHGACSFIKAKYLSGFKDLIFKYDNSLNAVVISHKE